MYIYNIYAYIYIRYIHAYIYIYTAGTGKTENTKVRNMYTTRRHIYVYAMYIYIWFTRTKTASSGRNTGGRTTTWASRYNPNWYVSLFPFFLQDQANPRFRDAPHSTHETGATDCYIQKREEKHADRHDSGMPTTWVLVGHSSRYGWISRSHGDTTRGDVRHTDQRFNDTRGHNPWGRATHRSQIWRPRLICVLFCFL